MSSHRPSDYMSFRGGDCWIFARAISELTGLPIYGAYDREGSVHHAFVYDEASGLAADALGFRPLADVTSGGRGNYGTRALSPLDLANSVGGAGIATATFQEGRACPPELSTGYSDAEWRYALKVARSVIRDAHRPAADRGRTTCH